MNKTLYDSIKKLSATEMSELRFKLKDSPVGLSFVDFFEKCTNRNFKNRDVVEHIYKDEIDKKPFSVLENRFFKLRKKITDEFLNTNAGDAGLLPEEELELHRCKLLIRDNDKETAYHRLVTLEKDCWEKNIFELLPAIIDQLIFCNQSFNRLERNEPLFARLENAIELLADISKTMMLARKVYEINFKRGIKYAKKELETLKDLAVKHKKYQRFDLCYHHVALYYKLGSSDYIEEMQVISRHYTQFRKLNEKYPLMPLIGYRINYKQYQHFHFQLMAVFYHFNRCEFEEAYLAMKEMWDMMEADETIFGIYKTESSYFNMINSMLATGRDVEADKIADLYFNFLKENEQTEKLSFAHTLKALIWCAAYPKIMNVNTSFFLQKIEEYIKALKRNDNMLVSLGETEMLKAKIYFLDKNFAKAIEQLKVESLKTHLDALGLYEFYKELFDLAFAGKMRTGSEELKKRLATMRYKTKSPTVLINLKWIATILSLR